MLFTVSRDSSKYTVAPVVVDEGVSRKEALTSPQQKGATKNKVSGQECKLYLDRPIGTAPVNLILGK